MSYLDQILESLEHINQNNRVVCLVSTYMGVSISVDVNIKNVDKKNREVTVVAHHQQKMPFLPATRVSMHSDLFPKPILARVSSIDVRRRLATLHELDYAFETMGKRKEIRVLPKDALKATITSAQKKDFNANVADISVDGISLILEDKNLEEIFSPQTSVRMSLKLPLSDETKTAYLSFLARVIYQIELDEPGKSRVGLRIYPNDQDKDALRRFIFDRQTDMFNQAIEKDERSGEV
jgi:hypothetical protein